MTFAIQSKNDLSTGAMLTVRFSEENFDEKAYYTIENDMPEFLVPFRCHSVDGQIECTYQLGSLVKLQYRFASLSPKEYAQFWKQVLQPLLDCDDWFLKPFSFVMDTRYLYTDRDGKKILYLYIPSKENWGGQEELRAMVIDLAQQNPATDPVLENQTLRAMMQEFRPKEFLQMLQVKQSAESEVVSQQNSASVPPVKSTTPVNAVLSESPVVSAVSAEKVSAQPTPPLSSGSEDIVIDLGGSKEKKKKKSGGLFGGKKEKPPAEPKRGLFGGKKTKSKEIIIGAGAENPVHLMESRVEENKVVPAIPVWIPMDEDESTQLDGGLCGAYLRLISDAPLPGNISVRVEQGRAFTIGRFDVSVGHKQSDFEFEKGTKAVSRRHAAIERDGDGYWIMDLSSSAGTFVNGEKLLPNMPKQLVRGCRVSFGTGGADYIWEE